MGAQWKQKWRELAADQKGKLVGKLVREIQVAAKTGGPTPEFNARLFVAIANAKKQSVTRDTIERAVAKASLNSCARLGFPMAPKAHAEEVLAELAKAAEQQNKKAA